MAALVGVIYLCEVLLKHGPWHLFLFTSVLWLLLASILALWTSADLFAPLGPLLVLFAMYGQSGISYELLYSQSGFLEGTLLRYYCALWLSIPGIALGFLLAFCGNGQSVRRQGQHSPKFILGGILAFCLLGFMVAPRAQFSSLNPAKIKSYTENAGQSRVEARRNRYSGIEGFFVQSTRTLLVVAVFLYAGRNRKRWILGAAVLVFLVATELMAGGKSGIIFIASTIGLFLHYRLGIIRRRHILLPAAGLYIFAVMLNHVRNTTDVMEMAKSAGRWISMAPGVLLPSRSGELNGPPIGLLTLIENLSNGGFSFSWGVTYLSEASVWIPRIVWPGRPLPLSEKFMTTFFPAEYARGLGRGFYIPAEGYWAFGFFGVLLTTIMYGSFVGAWYKFFIRRASSDVALLIYSVGLFPLVLAGPRTGVLLSLKALVMAVGPLLLIGWIESLVRSSRFRRSQDAAAHGSFCDSERAALE